MKKIYGRPKKPVSELKSTVAFYISKPNIKKITALAKKENTSKSKILDSILDKFDV